MIQMQKKRLAGASYSQQVIKDCNETLLFNLVRKLAPISRAELARISGLSPATVTVLTGELMDNLWIHELSSEMAECQRGRRPILLEVNAGRGYVITVEILSQGYICSLYDICLNQIATVRERICAPSAMQICQTVQTLSLRYEIPLERLLGIHVLYPGLFDAESCELGFSAVIEDSHMAQRDLIAVLRKQFPETMVQLSNVASAMAYAVYVEHAPQAQQPLVALSMYEGINSGVVLEEQGGIPLEAGHIMVQTDGLPCHCGNRGCLETLCSTPALFRAINERTSLRVEYAETYGADCNTTAMRQVADALAEGDAEVVAVLEEYAYHLCCGFVSIVNMLAIRSVYIGGTVYLLGEPFLQLLQKCVRENFQILTTSREVSVNLFDDDCENTRKAAVMQTLERIFQKG